MSSTFNKTLYVLLILASITAGVLIAYLQQNYGWQPGLPPSVTTALLFVMKVGKAMFLLIIIGYGLHLIYGWINPRFAQR